MQESRTVAATPSEVIALHIEILMSLLDGRSDWPLIPSILDAHALGGDIARLHAATAPTVAHEDTVAVYEAYPEEATYTYAFHEFVWRVTLLDGRGRDTRPYKAWLRRRFDGVVGMIAYDLAITLVYERFDTDANAVDRDVTAEARNNGARDDPAVAESSSRPNERAFVMETPSDERPTRWEYTG